MTGETAHIAPYRVADLSQRSPTRFSLRPDSDFLKALCETLKVSDLRKVTFQGQISALDKADWSLEGHLGATVVQPCVVTLAPVTTRVEADVSRRYLAQIETFDDDEVEEIEMPEDENAELLGTHIDVMDILAEALALNVPLYPRAENADLKETVFTEPGKKAMTDEDSRPFAGLASLRGKLSGDGEK